MTEERFWQLIDAARVEVGAVSHGYYYNAEAHNEAMEAVLCTLSPREVVGFYRHFDRWRHWLGGFPDLSARYSRLIGGSDDGFYDFRSFLVGQGLGHCISFALHPEWMEYAYENERFGYAALRVYEGMTQKRFPDIRPLSQKVLMNLYLVRNIIRGWIDYSAWRLKGCPMSPVDTVGFVDGIASTRSETE